MRNAMCFCARRSAGTLLYTRAKPQSHEDCTTADEDAANVANAGTAGSEVPTSRAASEAIEPSHRQTPAMPAPLRRHSFASTASVSHRMGDVVQKTRE
eukprot:scaffold521_cov137-Isochrysis_galbana.AAC.1